MKELIIKSLKFIFPYLLISALSVIITLWIVRKPSTVDIGAIKQTAIDSTKTAELINKDKLLKLKDDSFNVKLQAIMIKADYYQKKYSDLKKVYSNNPSLENCNNALLACDSTNSTLGFENDTLKSKLGIMRMLINNKDSLLSKYAIYTNNLVKTNAGLKLNNDALQNSLKNCDKNPNSSLSTISAGFGVYFAFK